MTFILSSIFYISQSNQSDDIIFSFSTAVKIFPKNSPRFRTFHLEKAPFKTVCENGAVT
nr:MAG TPA: hypothetical protein [Caudoviricetes sp.]DAP56320.1 MAG TPA: hypothetical protein [Caudoviricetes sp.]